jgi:hypothetical protein
MALGAPLLLPPFPLGCVVAANKPCKFKSAICNPPTVCTRAAAGEMDATVSAATGTRRVTPK